MRKNWHTLPLEEVFKEVQSNSGGIGDVEAKKRLQEFGANVLPEAKADSLLIIFFRQFQSPLIYVLFASSIAVFAIGETIDAFIILAVLFFNAVVGTIQEGRAQSTLQALKRFVETKATVLRDGKETIINDEDVVPGDIIIFQEGEKVPADARIISANNLKIDEASLTGESVPVHKVSEALLQVEAPVAEQKNILFKGTYIVLGNGRAVVIATGTDSVIGKIAKAITAIDADIPLKANIRYLSRAIIVAVAGVCAVLFLLGIILGQSLKAMFVTVVSLSVSIIPEGLPIVMTLVLATGVWRMSKRNALVKRLQAVEALGQARVIAVDKTGTITKNELTIQKVWTGGELFEIGGSGYESKGDIKFNGNTIDPVNHTELLFAGKIAGLCASARVIYSEQEKRWQISGDPTEAAMLVFAQKVGFHTGDLERELPLVAEIPFDYKIKYHATVHKDDKKNLLVVVGAPEVVLGLCRTYREKGKSVPLTKDRKMQLAMIFEQMSEQGLRMVAFAVKEDFPGKLNSESLPDLELGGFFGMKDALRPEVEEAIKSAFLAGIRVLMITGDHQITAKAIAREAGIYREGDEIVTGSDINTLRDEELLKKIPRVSVFARVTPEHKLRIINLFKKSGEVIAMTGDGVNDAPSLVAADLGIAMGKIGTEVAKEASDIVLMDDNFGSIVSAVEEGRNIYKTIKKVILYLFSTSVGEVLTITGALIFGYPLPILAVQIIWLNFVTDGFLDVSLAMEPKEKGLLERTFEKPKKYLVDRLMGQRMILMALPMMTGTIYLFQKYIETDPVKAWTISLTTLAVFQWFNAWNCRSEEKSIFQMNPFSNRFLVGATVIVIFLQALAVYNTTMQKILHTSSLNFYEWLIIIPVAGSVILVEELRKFFYRRKIIL